MQLLTRIQAYLRRTGTPPSRFGRIVVNDPRLVHDLKLGREPGGALVARVNAWLDGQEGAPR